MRIPRNWFCEPRSPAHAFMVTCSLEGLRPSSNIYKLPWDPFRNNLRCPSSCPFPFSFSPPFSTLPSKFSTLNLPWPAVQEEVVVVLNQHHCYGQLSCQPLQVRAFFWTLKMYHLHFFFWNYSGFGGILFGFVDPYRVWQPPKRLVDMIRER